MLDRSTRHVIGTVSTRALGRPFEAGTGGATDQRGAPRTMPRRRRPLRLAVLLLVLAELMLVAPPAFAMEIRDGDTVVVPAGTVVDDDLLATGQSVTIAGQVNGEVFAF